MNWRWRVELGIFGSIDMNRNDYQSGWDTDQFPNNCAEMALAFYEVLRAVGSRQAAPTLTPNCAAKLDAEDLILAHVGGMDACAAGLKAAAAMLDDGKLEAARDARYAGWDTADGKGLLSSDLNAITAKVLNDQINPAPRSGRQERLENLVNRYL